MRPILLLLVFPCILALVPSVSSASVSQAQGLSTAQIEGLMQSEFAFQAGEFSRALAFYKNRPLTSLTTEEIMRGSELAVVSGDFAWLQDALATPAAAAAQQAELLTLRFTSGIRNSDETAALKAWQALMALPNAQGAEISREIIDKHTPQFQELLERLLQKYAESPSLSNPELFELYLYAYQWQKEGMAKQFQTRLPPGSKHAKIAELLSVCLPEKQSLCSDKLAALVPADFDGLERQAILRIAQQSGLEQQAFRWLLLQTQDGNSYYQRIVLLGKQWDETKAVGLVSEIESDNELTAFQRSVLLGSAAELRKDWPGAEKHYRDALALNKPTTAAIRLAVVLFRKRELTEAMQLLGKIQEDTSLSDEIRREAFSTEIQFQQISQANSAGFQKNQNAVYQRALLVWPQAHLIRYQYAMRLFSQGQTNTALAELQTAIKSAPTDVDALNAYGYTLAKELDKPRSALQPLQQAFLLAQNRAEVLDSYGYVLHRLGRNAEALPPLQKAWQLTPSAVTAGHLARVFLQMGDKQQAQDFLVKGLELDGQEADLIALKELLP